MVITRKNDIYIINAFNDENGGMGHWTGHNLSTQSYMFSIQPWLVGQTRSVKTFQPIILIYKIGSFVYQLSYKIQNSPNFSFTLYTDWFTDKTGITSYIKIFLNLMQDYLGIVPFVATTHERCFFVFLQ